MERRQQSLHREGFVEFGLLTEASRLRGEATSGPWGITQKLGKATRKCRATLFSFPEALFDQIAEEAVYVSLGS